MGGTTAWWQSKCWPVLLSWCASARAWRRSSWCARCDSRKACSPALRSARATCWSRRTRSQLSSSFRAQVECAGCAEHSPGFVWWFWALAGDSWAIQIPHAPSLDHPPAAAASHQPPVFFVDYRLYLPLKNLPFLNLKTPKTVYQPFIKKSSLHMPSTACCQLDIFQLLCPPEAAGGPEGAAAPEREPLLQRGSCSSCCSAGAGCCSAESSCCSAGAGGRESELTELE